MCVCVFGGGFDRRGSGATGGQVDRRQMRGCVGERGAALGSETGNEAGIPVMYYYTLEN